LPQLKELLKDQDGFVRIEAARAILELSPDPFAELSESIEVLISGLKQKKPGLSQAAAQGLAGVGKEAVPALEELLTESSPTAVVNACDTLTMIGPPASDAVDRLLDLADADDLEVRAHALRALGAIGGDEKIVPVLAKALKSDSAVIRTQAAIGLGNFGEKAKSAVPELAAALKDDEEPVRRAAATSLGEIGPPAKDAVPNLVAALDDASGSVTLDAVHALARIGKPAVPALIERLERPEFQLLVAAVLEQMGPDAAPAVDSLTELLSSGDLELKREALLALAAIGPDAKSSVPELLKILKDEKSPVRPAAAYALGRIGDKRAVSALEEAVDSDNALLGLASIWALFQFDPEREDYIRIAVPRLTDALAAERPRIRREAATTLARIGVKAKEAVPALQKSLKDEDPGVRMESLVALAEIGPGSQAAVDDIVAILQEEDPAFRPVACYALGRIGSAAKAAAPLLRRLVAGRDPMTKTVAAWALVKIDPNEKDIATAIPLLAGALQRAPNPQMRVVAAETLGDIGGGSDAAREALTSAKEDSNETVRKVAAAALAKLK
jgi:HEAT repeat protein